MTLATASLVEGKKPYHLPVELARGTVNRLRNQIAAWEALGLNVPLAVTSRTSASLEHLSRAATGQDRPLEATDAAQQAIITAQAAMSELVTSYTQQSLAARLRQPTRAIKLLGVNLGRKILKEHIQKDIVATFNSIVVPLPWRELEPKQGKYDWTLTDRQVEWCRLNGLKACLGPILQFDKASLPNWLYLWEDDFQNLAELATGYVQAAVERYRGKVTLWHCAARMNTGDVLSLSEEQRLRVAMLAVETARKADPKTPQLLWIDQPWGEFMSRQSCDLSPLHFADALIRSDLGLAGLGLELNLGYQPGGSQPRELLDFSRLIDRWSCLGLPLVISLTIPSDNGADPRAQSPAKVVPSATPGQVSVASQSVWVAELAALLLSKQTVQGVLWNQLLDSQPHEFCARRLVRWPRQGEAGRHGAANGTAAVFGVRGAPLGAPTNTAKICNAANQVHPHWPKGGPLNPINHSDASRRTRPSGRRG